MLKLSRHEKKEAYLRDGDLLATEGGKGEVSDLELGCWSRHGVDE
jgi:hypothetical protein